ncbi:hypothetical protein BGZ94_001125 [Podila epigama]|nr:hypothetical protein BGZ94_001125 [Podila epigama]
MDDTMYQDHLADQGHESDPSELIRQPVLFGTTPPNDYLSTFDHNKHSMSIRRPNRSMSLSMDSTVNWADMHGPFPSALPPSAPPQQLPPGSHGEVVPYSQEWRVILRSLPRGRTVLYNPQMQSLVVQTTVGLDSHPMDDATNNSAYMDTNYFRMLADANIALSRRGSLQETSRPTMLSHSPIGTPTSSSRASLDLDSHNPAHDFGSNNNNSNKSTDSPHLSHDALNQGYYERFFVEQKKLGRGYRGSVFLCQHILDGIHLGEYAIKKVAVGDNHDWLVQMLREVHLLERLHHPNIVGYKHAWLENHQLHKFGPEVTCLFILMECANGGNLEEYIEHPPSDGGNAAAGDINPQGSGQEADSGKKVLTARERILQSKRGAHLSSLGKDGEGRNSDEGTSTRHYLSITEIWSFFFDICEGLAHLHRLGIIHRDLKPPNLLLSYSDSRVKGSKGERPRILITDFGECEILDQGVKRDRTGATGTLEFLAPELLAVDANGRYTDEFSFKGDMWSLGMVLYYLCYSRLPYSQIDDVDILREEIRGFKTITLPRDEPGDRVIPEELKILIRVLLSTEKSKRPSCDDILQSLSMQRDRMMHGDMDSPVTPIRTSGVDSNSQGFSVATLSTSTSVSELPSKGTWPAEGRVSELEDRQQHELSIPSATRRAKHAAHTLRPASHPITQFVALKRRKSRTSAVIADSSKTGSNNGAGGGGGGGGGAPAHGHGHVSHRNTTSPSVNLHKKSKPLGLGLRHMLRRRMMHPHALRSLSQQPLHHLSDVEPSHDRLHFDSRIAHQGAAMDIDMHSLHSNNTLAGSIPVTSFSGGLMTTPVVGQHHADLLQVQNLQARKQAARKSMLGEQVQSPISSSSSLSHAHSTDTNITKGASAATATAAETEATSKGTTTSSLEDSQDLAHQQQSHGAAYRSKEPPRRETESSSDSEGDDESGHEDLARIRGRQEQHRQEHQQQLLSKARMRDPVSYWSNLAASHAQEQSRIVAGNEEVEPRTLTQKARQRNLRRTQLKRAKEKAAVVNDDEHPDSSASSSVSDNERPLVESADHAASTRPRLHSLSLSSVPSRSALSPKPETASPLSEQFSVHFMFLSLVLRLWFCQQLCNPIMVRPFVLYPVLVLTVVWDRYFLSVLSGVLGSASSGPEEGSVRGSDHHHRTSIAGQDRAGRRSSRSGLLTMTGAPGADDTRSSSSECDDTRDTVRRRHIRQRDESVTRRRIPDEGEARLQAEDGEYDDDDDENPRSAGGVIPTNEPFSTVWQALLSGVAVQLLWIGAVRLFSRGGLCVV